MVINRRNIYEGRVQLFVNWGGRSLYLKSTKEGKGLSLQSCWGDGERGVKSFILRFQIKIL